MRSEQSGEGADQISAGCRIFYSETVEAMLGLFQNYLVDFSVEWGGPPFPPSFFGQNDFPLRGGEYPPIPLRKKSAKNVYFWPKNAYFSPF